jgi:hypothetical protein
VSNTCNIGASTELSRLRFSIALPPTLPRNGRTPTGRLLYWLVGTIEGLPEGKNRSKAVTRLSSSNNDDSTSAPSSSSGPSATSALPSYSSEGSDPSDVEWLPGSVQSERRIAVSHNPNPEGGVTRLDDDFTHNLSEFGTCRIQTRVNEVGQHRLTELMFIVVYGLPLSIALLMSSSFSTCYTVRYTRQTRRNSHHHTATDRQNHRYETIV